MMTSIEPEWRWKALPERLAFAYSNQLFTDVDITVFLGDERHLFKAHGCILAHFSPILAKEIYGSLTKRKSPIELNGIDAVGLSYILRYLYHVPIDFSKETDNSILLSAYHAAQVLGMTAISSRLREEIFTNLLTPSLTTDNSYWKLLELSSILRLNEILQGLLELAKRYPINVLRADSLVKASARTLIRVLDMDKLNVPETEVFEAIVRWKVANSKLPFVEDFVNCLLGCLRFRSVSNLDFLRILSINNRYFLIPPADAKKVLLHITKPSNHPLPSWCSTKFRILTSTKDDWKPQPTKTPPVNQKPAITLLTLFTEQKYSDVCFRLVPDEILIRAHRSVLAIGSIVFEKMFFGPLANTRKDIEVSAKCSEGFKTMIRYFYEDSDLPDVFTKTPDLAVGTLDAALKYGSNVLKNLCLLHIVPDNNSSTKKQPKSQKESKPPATKSGSRERALLHNNASKNNITTKTFLESSDFLNAPIESVVAFLKSHDVPGVREIDLLNRAADWIEQQSNVHKWNNKTKYDVLSCIRFDEITPPEFCAFLSKHELVLTERECLTILRHLVDKRTELPSWCYKEVPLKWK